MVIFPGEPNWVSRFYWS